MHAWMHARMHAWMHAWMRECMHASMHASMQVCKKSSKFAKSRQNSQKVAKITEMTINYSPVRKRQPLNSFHYCFASHKAELLQRFCGVSADLLRSFCGVIFFGGSGSLVRKASLAGRKSRWGERLKGELLSPTSNISSRAATGVTIKSATVRKAKTCFMSLTPPLASPLADLWTKRPEQSPRRSLVVSTAAPWSTSQKR